MQLGLFVTAHIRILRITEGTFLLRGYHHHFGCVNCLAFLDGIRVEYK